eukprot:1139138-Pelagomonas_calceolata.AAC.4
MNKVWPAWPPKKKFQGEGAKDTRGNSLKQRKEGRQAGRRNTGLSPALSTGATLTHGCQLTKIGPSSPKQH